MPFYTFRCNSCKIEETVLQNFNDTFPICKECDKEMVRQFKPSGDFKLSGRGWAYDGYDKNKSLRKGNPKYNDF